MEAPIPMDNKAKTLPPYGGMMPPLNHHLQLHGPAPPGFQRTPPPPPPPHDGQPHGLPAPIPHTSTYEQHWHQPYPPSHYETAAQRRHSNPVTQPPPQSQPPPPGPPPLPSHPHAPYPPPSQHPSAQPQSRELPQLPPGDPYHRPNSLPAPAPSHPVSEPHSPRTYRPMNGAQSEPTPHSAPPPGDYRPARVPYNGPGEPPATNGEHAAPPPGYMQHAPPHHGPPPQGAMYDNSGAPYPRQRKVARAQQACDQCRARKAKCDEGRPACSHCRENNIECKYKDIPPQKQEKSTQLVLDGVRQNEDNSRERYDTLMGRFLEIEQLLKYIITKSNIPLPPEKSPRPLKENATSPNGLLESKPSTPAPQAPEVRLNNIPAASSSQSEMNRDITGYLKTVQYEQSRPLVEGGNKEIEGELSIPQNHKTAAHKLLEWDSIKRLLDRKIDPNYVLINERKRGLIRLYGCGEGCDHDTENHWRQNRRYPGASPATDSTSPQSAEEYSQASSPNWGYGLPMPPQNRPGPNCGGVDQSGFLNTQPDVVRRLLDSYMSNMHILHPIMDKNTLPQKVERFIQQYGQYHRNMDYSNTANIANEGRGMKRKRSAEAIYTEALNMSRSPSSEKWSPRRIEHSIENAVILLVLALGAICEHKGALPGFAPDPNERHRDKQDFASSPEVQAVLEEILSPPSGPVSGLNSRLYQSPSIQSSDPAWTPNQRPNSRLGPEGMTETSYLKNIDVIPGLAYYAYAAGILGEMQGGCELPFVQAAILASFYAGQLAHPFQSHGWICQAARACSFLTRKDEYNVMQNSSLKELYEFAYWTCLQHESDLLAELDFTASGVTQSESRVLLPGGTFTMDQPRPMTDHRTRVMFFYSAQIHLRKVLNQVHRDLYNVDVKKLPHIVLSILGLNLDAWKSSLPAEMQWSEGDPPSDDINTARLRAKYYGARYIIYRPVLELALHSKSPKAEGKGKSEKESKPSASSFKAHDYQAPSMARWSSEPGMRQNMRDISDIEDTLKLEELDNDTRRACEQCITAAIESTRAFHNIKGRPIVTNIFGTAHAQFGNMLVLSATYMSNLRELVQVKDLQQLLKRTIQFLAMYKDISPTLMADAQILSGIYYRIFKKEVQTSFTTESFGST